MKLQQLVFKVEELKALVSLYEQTQSSLAQATAVQATIAGEGDEEQQHKVTETLEQLQTRLQSIETLLTERTRTSTIDDAVDAVRTHLVRLEQYQQTRTEQIQLRMQLDLEMAIGQVPAETRQQVEAKLQDYQRRMEALVALGEKALGVSRLVVA